MAQALSVRSTGVADAATSRVPLRPFAGVEITEISHQTETGFEHRQMAHNGDRRCLLVLQLAGWSVVAQFGVEARLEAGDVVLIDSALAWRCCFFGRSRQLCLHLPRALLQTRMPPRQITPACLIKGQSGIGLVLRRLIVAMTSAPGTFNAHEEAGVRNALVDVAVAAVSSEREDGIESRARRQAAAQHRTLLEHYIDAWLPDPTLCPAKVAEDHGISTRHLHRLFKDAGTSFGSHVRTRRLERCRDDLADPRFSSLPITEIAFRWGFSDSSHFSRSFKAAFGRTARDFRAAAGEQPAAIPARLVGAKV